MSSAKFLCLTDRQFEVLRLIHGDMTDKRIADELKCSRFTVRAHMQQIFIRLGVKTRLAAALVFERHLHK